MNTNIISNRFSQRVICISSVVVKESGFEDYRFACYLVAQELGFVAKRNPEDVGSTQNEFEAALNDQCSVLILLVGDVQSDVVMKECRKALDNCIPIYVFMKEKDSGINPHSKEFTTQLSKVTFDRNCTIFKNAEELYAQVKARLSHFLSSQASAFPLLNSEVVESYRYLSNSIKNAKKQIILYQKTSSLLLGPRKVDYEKDFYTSIMEWEKQRQPGMKFLHVFSEDQTISELKNNLADYEDVKKYQKRFKSLWIRAKGDDDIAIQTVCEHSNVSYVIIDREMMLVFPIEKARYTIILPSDLMRINELQRIKSALQYNSKKITDSDLKKFYI